MAVSSVALKALFGLLACVMAVQIVYLFVADFFLSCFDPKARWTQVTILDFCIDISLISAWFFYKESRLILRVIFVFLLFWLGSFIICGYVLLELFKLSPEESSVDPIYFVLLRRHKRDIIRHTSGVSVVTTRIIYVSLGVLMLGVLVFVVAVDGSSFHAEIFSPCMITMVVDLSIHVVVFSVWVTYKESSWINAIIWIILILCFGSIAMCAYVVRELFYVSPEQPAYLILFNKSRKDLMSSDPLLMEHGGA